MSKPDSGHELIRGQLMTADEELSAERMSEAISKVSHNRDSVTPFAKDMVDNVVTGALSVLDASRKEGKTWKDVLAGNKISSDVPSSEDTLSPVGSGATSFSQRAETPSVSSANGQRPVVQVMHLRVRENELCDAGVHAEQVAKIVKGLQDIQIGDSTFVLPADGSNIEKQVKRAVQNINSLEFGDTETARLIVCDGQGDVDAKILEAEVGPPNNAKPQNDPSKISTCLLHKMIEEMEVVDPTKGASLPDHGNKESIASWEESEEKFIRIIEGPSGEERSPASSENQELCPETENRSEHLGNSLRQVQHVFLNEEIIVAQEDGNHSRDLLDNFTDEEPYWCTAGLIKTVVSPQHCEELRASTLEGGSETKKSRNSLSIVECDVKQRDDMEERLKEKEKGKGKKKQSLGRKLRKFFSKFSRSKDS